MWNRRVLMPGHRGEKKEKGQSLVELALLLPILLLLFLGLIEVGFALRAYLVLVNADREAARFAARGNFSDEEIAQRALAVLEGGGLEVRTTGPEPNVTIVITRIHVGLPDDPCPGDGCVIEDPVYITGTLRYGTRLQAGIEEQLKHENDILNTTLLTREPNALPTSNDVIAVEIIYEYEQVLKAPLISNVLPDPIPMYAWTLMRVTRSRAQ